MDHKKEINKKPNLNVSSISVSSLQRALTPPRVIGVNMGLVWVGLGVKKEFRWVLKRFLVEQKQPIITGNTIL